MKLSTVKIESLLLMHAFGAEEPNPSLLSTTYRNDLRYRDYLLAMPGAINRAFAQIENRLLVPHKVTPLTAYTLLGGRAHYDLAAIEDLCRVVRLVRTTENGTDSDAPYVVEAGGLLTDIPKTGETLRLIYEPFVERIDLSTDDDSEIELPENLAAAIPYYVKSDLYAAEEPDEASAARQNFNALLDGIPLDATPRSGTVNRVYAQ